LMTPITIRYKLLLQKMSSPDHGWDEELDEELSQESRKILSEMVRARDIPFPRSIKPPGSMGKLQLVGWFDGGDPASGGALYSLYEREEPTEEGEVYQLRLMGSKARVTPSGKTAGRNSTPQSEMRGLLLLTRLTTALLAGLSECPVRISIVGDSECTISSVECDHRLLDIWFGNRVAEVLEHQEAWRKMGIEVDPLEHWPTETNIADLTTKGKAGLRDMDEV